MAKWLLNGYGNCATKTDSSELVYMEGDDERGVWLIVHERGETKEWINTGTADQLEAKTQFLKYVNRLQGKE